MRRPRRTSATRAVLALFALLGGPAAAGGYRDLGILISSGRHGYTYAYAPAIVREGGTLHMFFCSYGRPGIWDYVRYASSDDDGRTWTDPVVALEGTDETGERAVCDPSLVRYQAPGDPRPYWYLHYSGNAAGIGTAVFVARAEAVAGPYAKWSRRGTWEVGAPDPAVVIAPTRPKPDGSGFYGAGQQAVVVRDGRLALWFTDDTTCDASCPKVFATESADPTRFPRRVATEGAAVWSMDVKRRPDGRFALFGIVRAHQTGATLVTQLSADGIRWDAATTLCGEGCLDPYAHNLGVAGDATGGLARAPVLAVYGAPAGREGRCGICWGKWDLAGGLLPEAPAIRNAAPAGQGAR
jgi:hypothetical protein